MSDKTTDDFLKKLDDAIDKETKALKRPTVLICGYTGTGKTTLIQKVCGKSVIPDHEINDYAPGTKAYKEYSSTLIRFWDSQGLEPSNKEKDFIRKTNEFVKSVQRNADLDEHIHIVWYCIQGSGGRVTDTDLTLINKIFDKDNTLVLITKNDITKQGQEKA